MKTFYVTYKTGRTSKVRADTYQRAADAVARKMCGRKATANRLTGNAKMSGWFRSFKPWKGGGSTSCGQDFHVFE